MANTIEIAPATQVDQVEWDDFVLSHPNATPYHLFAWGNAVTQAYGHKIYYLMARRDGGLVGILPLVHLKFACFINELVALPFCDVGYCLSTDSNVEQKLLTGAQRLSQELKIRNIQLRGQLLYSDINSLPSFTQLESRKSRMLLYLPESSETLFMGFKAKLRSQVRKAEKNGVVFRWAGKDGIDSFYSIFCNNMRDLGSPVHSRKFFAAIMDHFGEKARIGVAEYEGKCISAGLILSLNEQTSIPWASSLRKYNNLASNMLMYWNFLKYAVDSGKKLFDFGRSTDNEGTFHFKSQWGAEPFPLIWYSSRPNCSQRSTTKMHIKLFQQERAAKIWKILPVPIANCVGPQLRKYINL